MPFRFAPSRIHVIAVAALFCLLPLARAQAADTITATATGKTAAGATSTAPVSITVDRFSTDTERDEVLAALKKGGTDAVRALLATRPAIGAVKVGTATTPIKYVYQRTTPGGRLITVVTGSVIGGAGAAAPPKAGESLGLVLLETGSSSHGELIPATAISVDDKGAIVTGAHGDNVMRLSEIKGK